jgi:serine/threonine-protein kinase
VFTSTGNRPAGGLVVQDADGSRPPDTLLALDRGDSWPTSVSPDGRWLAYYGASLGSGDERDALDPKDLFFLDLTNRESRRVRLPGAQRGARFAPDGRWVAYQSSESGREEVHVRPWPAMDANFPISAGGGTEPLWSPDGAVQDGRLQRTSPRVLFSRRLFHDFSGDISWDLGPGGRFLMLRPVPGGRATVHVALNWIDDVRARLERGR